mgnify:CR=1 FL=1
MLQANLFSKHLRSGVRGLLSTAELGMRHGPRLGTEVGAAAGSIFPVIGTAAGALVGLVVGGPLGIFMGLIGGAVNRRRGWLLGGAFPGALLLVASVVLSGTAILAPVSIIATICGGIAGYRLGLALEKSPDGYFERFQDSTKAYLAPTPFWIRLGLCALFLLTLADLGYTVINCLASRG